MINYYTKRLGLDGHIQKEKLLLQEDKTQLEKKLEGQEKELETIREEQKKNNKLFSHLAKMMKENPSKPIIQLT